MPDSRVQRLTEGDYGSEHYWLGYLSQGMRMAVEALEGTPGTAQTVRSLKRSLAEWESSPVARPNEEMVAYAVVNALGECEAIRGSYIDALKAKGHAESYLLDAESCGHSLSHSWVAARLPITILTVTEEERVEMLEDGTPNLDREP